MSHVGLGMTVTKLVLDGNKSRVANLAVRMRDLCASAIDFRAELDRSISAAMKDECYTREIETSYKLLVKEAEDMIAVFTKAHEEIGKITKEGN